MGALPLAIRTFCWGIILASVIGFWLITFVRPSRWYRDTAKHNAFFTRWDMPYDGTKKTVGFEAAFLYGLWNAQIVFQWLPNVSAIIFAAALMMYNKSRREQREQQQGGAAAEGEAGCLARFGSSLRLVYKRVMSYQLPPRGFWAYWCDGMSVLDALLVGVYLGLNVCWLYETYRRTFAGVDKQVDTGKLSGRAATQAYTLEAGTTWGWVSVVNLLLLFYPVSRSSFLQWLCGAGFPQLIRYHRWMSHGMMWVLLMHTLLFYAAWWDMGVWVEETFRWNRHAINNFAGSIAWVISLAIWFCSFNWVRRKYFELFYNVHIYGVPLFLIFSLMHYKYLVYYMLPGLIVYLLDLTFRFWQLNTDKSMATVSVSSADSKIVTVELFFTHNAEIPPASFVYLHFPTITQLQRHPFTISEVHRDATTGVQRAVIHVKALEHGWSAELLSAAQRSRHSTTQLPVTIDGHYGVGHTLGDRPLDAAVLVAGGIGATPIMSILLDLVRRHAVGLTAPKRVHLVWAAKSADEFEAVMPQEVKEAAGGGWLEVSLHTTRSSSPSPSFKKTGGGSDNAETSSKDSASLAKTKAGQQTLWGISTTGLLLGYDRGYLAYAIAGTLAFFGAYAGMLPAAAYDAHEAKITKTGSIYCAVGVIQFFGILLGAMVPPLLVVVLPSYFYRLRASKEPAQYADAAGTTNGGKGGVVVEGGKLFGTAATGRPDLQQVLADAQALYKEASEVPVVVAGPRSMCDAAREACHVLNTPQAPFLDFQPHTFTL